MPKSTSVCYTTDEKNECFKEVNMAKFLVTYHGGGMPHDPEQWLRQRQLFRSG